MTDSQRQLYLKIGAGAVVGLFLLDRIVISPAIDNWSTQTDRIAGLHQKIDRGQQLIDREDSIRGGWNKMVAANLPADPSAAENTAIQAIARWASTGGITFTSLTPEWDHSDPGFETLVWRASATGTQAEFGRFIYEMETDKLPVNLTEFEIATRDEHGIQLTMTARFSFLHLDVPGSEMP